jgi:hypothetical protein
MGARRAAIKFLRVKRGGRYLAYEIFKSEAGFMAMVRIMRL